MKLLAVLVFVLAGCAQGIPLDAVETRPDLVLSSVNVPAGMLEDAAARWSAATGLDIRVGEGGVPVEFVEQAYMFGTPVCGVSAGPAFVQVSTQPPAGKCRSVADVLAHEVGHALCRSFTQSGDCHADTGLMASPSYETAIDGATLSAVCAFAPCSAFVPEG
jgi:hypothetical protein